MSTLIIFSVLHLLISLVCGAPLAPALYVFGDSLFDSGNNNLLPTVSKANFKPYGVDFAKGDTGRFTNGRLVPDFIAEFLGLPYPPPCISIRTSTPVTGLNYASASCGILPETGQSTGKCLSLDDQIDLFQRTVKSSLPNHFEGPNELMKYLSKSIFVVCIGSNDYMSNYLSDTSKHNTPQEFAHLLLDKLSLHFQRLYNLGARKVVMYEIGPIGCIPSMTRKITHNGKCAEELNELVSYFNDNLLGMLQNLTSTLPNSIFARGLAYSLKPCPNPNQHYFFDAYHLTESVYSVLASHCINDRSVCSPTLKELVQM